MENVKECPITKFNIAKVVFAENQTEVQEDYLESLMSIDKDTGLLKLIKLNNPIS